MTVMKFSFTGKSVADRRMNTPERLSRGRQLLEET